MPKHKKGFLPGSVICLAVLLGHPAAAQDTSDHCFIHAEFVEVVVRDYYHGTALGMLVDLLHVEMEESQLRDSLEGVARFLYTSLPPSTDDVDRDARGLSESMLDGCLSNWEHRHGEQ